MDRRSTTEPLAATGCERHRGDPHNLCEACWAVEPASAAKGVRRVVIVSLVIDAPMWDDETVAANLADDLREAGWEPAGISIIDPALAAKP